MLVRRAVVGDAARIAEVDVLSWQGAYRGLLPQTRLDALRPGDRVPGWTDVLQQSAWPRRGVLVVKDRDEIIGFADLRPTRDSDHATADVGEIVAFYVLPACWRSGVGRALMSATVDAFRVAGFAFATLWVVEADVRATSFYAALGWRFDGTVEDTVTTDGTPIRYIRYRRDFG